jgi:hypothetical protein
VRKDKHIPPPRPNNNNKNDDDVDAAACLTEDNRPISTDFGASAEVAIGRQHDIAFGTMNKMLFAGVVVAARRKFKFCERCACRFTLAPSSSG